jgi:hypothetical protein
MSKILAAGLVLTTLAAFSGVIGTLYYKGKMNEEMVRTTSAIAEKESALASIETLKDVLADNKDTTNFILNMNVTAQEKQNETQQSLMDADRKTAEVTAQLDRMLLTEHYEAVKEPFQRGNAANDRLTDIVCRAWGPWASNNPHCSSSEDNGDAASNSGN